MSDVTLFKISVLDNIVNTVNTEIDILTLDYSSSIEFKPSVSLLSNIDINHAVKDTIDTEILHVVLSEILTKTISSISMVMLEDKIINILIKYISYSRSDIESIDTHTYVLNIYNKINSFIDMYTTNYYDVRGISILDNLVDISRFFLIVDYGIVINISDYVFSINLMLYRKGDYSGNENS